MDQQEPCGPTPGRRPRPGAPLEETEPELLVDPARRRVLLADEQARSGPCLERGPNGDARYVGPQVEARGARGSVNTPPITQTAGSATWARATAPERPQWNAPKISSRSGRPDAYGVVSTSGFAFASATSAGRSSARRRRARRAGTLGTAVPGSNAIQWTKPIRAGPARRSTSIAEIDRDDRDERPTRQRRRAAGVGSWAVPDPVDDGEGRGAAPDAGGRRSACGPRRACGTRRWSGNVSRSQTAQAWRTGSASRSALEPGRVDAVVDPRRPCRRRTERAGLLTSSVHARTVNPRDLPEACRGRTVHRRRWASTWPSCTIGSRSTGPSRRTRSSASARTGATGARRRSPGSSRPRSRSATRPRSEARSASSNGGSAGDPVAFVDATTRGNWAHRLDGFRHRWIRGDQLGYLALRLRELYRSYDSLESVFLEGYAPAGRLRRRARPALGAPCAPPPQRGRAPPAARDTPRSSRRRSPPRTAPASGSPSTCAGWSGPASRTSGSGPGSPTGALRVPLDQHVFWIAYHTGLTQRRTRSWAAVEEVSEALRRIDPIDPVKYDFVLCHTGISGDCPKERDLTVCGPCTPPTRLPPLATREGGVTDLGRDGRRRAAHPVPRRGVRAPVARRRCRRRRPGAGASPTERVRIAHLHDEEARVAERRRPHDRGRFGPRRSFGAAPRDRSAGAPREARGARGGGCPGFGQGAIRARMGDERLGDRRPALPIADLVALARYALVCTTAPRNGFGSRPVYEQPLVAPQAVHA